MQCGRAEWRLFRSSHLEAIVGALDQVGSVGHAAARNLGLEEVFVFDSKSENRDRAET